MEKDKLIHNINSNLSSINQALPIVSEILRSDPEQAEKILDLCKGNFEKLLLDWESLKDDSLS